MKKSIEQLMNECLAKESIFPMDSAQTSEKPLTGSVDPEDLGKEEDEEYNEEFQEASKLYIEGKLSGKEFAKIIKENKDILHELNVEQVVKFTMAFLKGLRILKKLRVGNPLVVVATECTTFACRKLLVPRLIRDLRDSTRVITDEVRKAKVHKVIDTIEKYA